MRRILLGVLALTACAPGPTPAPRPEKPVVDWSATDRVLDSAIAAGAAPGAVLGVSWHGARHVHSAGVLGIGLPTPPDQHTIYDLASLTKVVGLTSAFMVAVQDGLVDLDAPVDRCIPAFAGNGKAGVTSRHLLTHSSGLPAWRPLYRETGSRSAGFALADSTPLETLPGGRMVYSDLGAMVLTQCVEKLFGARLDSVLVKRVFGPLGMQETRYLPPRSWLDRIAPTENDPWRGRVLRGEVHDENAARLDGVSGHAGLFSSTRDLLIFGEAMLAAWNGVEQGTAEQANTEQGNGTPRTGDTGRFSPSVLPGPCSTAPCSALPVIGSLVREFTHQQDVVPGSSRALGWDTPSQPSSAGARLSSQSFGHTGFTGTSIWIDPARDLVIVLLSNRVHPTRENPKWGTVRGLVADQVALAVDSSANR